VEPVAVGDTLTDMPLFLAPDWYVSVPLEATYEPAYRGVPRRFREVLDPTARHHRAGRPARAGRRARIGARSAPCETVGPDRRRIARSGPPGQDLAPRRRTVGRKN
jgi:hypothetical protein